MRISSFFVVVVVVVEAFQFKGKEGKGGKERPHQRDFAIKLTHIDTLVKLFVRDFNVIEDGLLDGCGGTRADDLEFRDLGGENVLSKLDLSSLRKTHQITQILVPLEDDFTDLGTRNIGRKTLSFVMIVRLC